MGVMVILDDGETQTTFWINTRRDVETLNAYLLHMECK